MRQPPRVPFESGGPSAPTHPAESSNLGRSGRHGRSPDRAFGVAVVLFGLFVVLGLLAMAGSTFAADRAIILTVHSWSAPTLTALMRGATELGDALVVVPICVVGAFFLFRDGDRVTAVIFVLAIATTPIVVCGAKLAFARPRPELIPLLVVAQGFSYPSGHTAAATVTYGLSALIFAPRLPRRWQRWAIGITALALIALVALSRVYLGVHYPSDVVGAFLLGSGLISLWWGIRIMLPAS